MEVHILSEHLMISLLPWLVGVFVGGSLGYICARVIHGLFSALPRLRRPSTLVPWRTAVMTLPLLSPLNGCRGNCGRVFGICFRPAIRSRYHTRTLVPVNT